MTLASIPNNVTIAGIAVSAPPLSNVLVFRIDWPSGQNLTLGTRRLRLEYRPKQPSVFPAETYSSLELTLSNRTCLMAVSMQTSTGLRWPRMPSELACAPSAETSFTSSQGYYLVRPASPVIRKVAST